MFVVVVLVVIMVIFWCLQNSWLCVCVFWPNVGGGANVVFVVDHVVLDVVIVVICCCCDSFEHGEVRVILVVVVGCPCDDVALIVVCVMVRRLWVMLLMLW